MINSEKSRAFPLSILFLSAAAEIFLLSAKSTARESVLASVPAFLLLWLAVNVLHRLAVPEGRPILFAVFLFYGAVTLSSMKSLFDTVSDSASFSLCLPFVLLLLAYFTHKNFAELPMIAALLMTLLGVLLLLLLFSCKSILQPDRLFVFSAAENHAGFQQAFFAAFRFFPEYLAAVFYRQNAVGGGKGQQAGFAGESAKLLALVLLAQNALLIFFELVFGCDPFAVAPFYAAARQGRLGVFGRLDFLQTILWTVLLIFRLAFCLWQCAAAIPKLKARHTAAAVGALYLAFSLLGTDLNLQNSLLQLLVWGAFIILLSGGMIEWCTHGTKP